MDATLSKGARGKPTMETNKQMDDLKARIKELSDGVSKLRKKGFYTRILDIKMLAIPAKLQMADATKADSDLKKIQDYLTSLETELKEIEAQGKAPTSSLY